jgi:hypothetical protein
MAARRVKARIGAAEREQHYAGWLDAAARARSRA